MSRFFKSAAFPILIVVVLAFLAVKLVNPSTTNHRSHSYQTLVAKELPNREVSSVEFKNKGKALEVKLNARATKKATKSASSNRPRRELIKELESRRRRVQRRIGKEQRAARRCSPTSSRSSCSSASGSSS